MPAGNTGLQITLDRSVCGPLENGPGAHLDTVRDSIVDGRGAAALTAPAVAIERTTVLGAAGVRSIQASNSIFTGDVVAERRQTGCVRYSYLPPGSRVPRRFRCQPDGDSRARPVFTSTTYGDPGYCQLAADCPPEIAGGAEDEGEMGAWNFIEAAHRMANLRARLDEYLRFGLEAGSHFVT
jgi:hypothetical protein